MNECNLKKVVITIIALMIAMLFVFASFAETVDELKGIYVTRDEVASWASSESAYLATLEFGGQEKVQKEVMYQMWLRGIKDKSIETISSSELQSMEDRKASEMATTIRP